jgi:hypothetical protein
MKEYYYVYKITNKILNKHYIGYSSCNCFPEKDIGHEYFSSSSDKEFMNNQKLNSRNYKYTVIETFDNREDAISLEVKLHKRYNVAKNESFYNRAKQTSTGFCFDSTGENNPMYGKNHTLKSKKKISINKIGTTASVETKKYMSIVKTGENNPMYGKNHTIKSKKKISINKIGIKQIIVTCSHCPKEGGISLMKRYHFDNCKYKVQ